MRVADVSGLRLFFERRASGLKEKKARQLENGRYLTVKSPILRSIPLITRMQDGRPDYSVFTEETAPWIPNKASYHFG